MRYEKHYKDEKTGEWKSIVVEEDGDFVFSTGTDVPLEKLRKKKNDKDDKAKEK